MSNILCTHLKGHDMGIYLIQDGKLKYAIEEERLERYKHGTTNPHQKGVPTKSIDWILKESGLKMSDIDHITMPVNAKYTFKQIPTAVRNAPKFYLGGGLWGGSIFGVAFKFAFWDNYIANTGLQHIKKIYGHLPDYEFIEHHTSHAASSYRCSGFSKANILTMDGIGGLEAISMKVGNGNEMENMKSLTFPHSLGAFYGGVTSKLGFSSGEEGSVQGLAAYGNPDAYDFSKIVHTSKGEFKLDLNKLDALPRLPWPITQRHRDIAASLQKTLEECALNLVEHMYEQTGYKKLCLAGGVALNSSMNGTLLQSDFVDDIYIQPVSGDGGTPLGAGLEFTKSRMKMNHAYWGPQFSNSEIEAELKTCGLRYERQSDIGKAVAELLANQKIVGWFQGRMEMGPRALGNRSILCDPRDSGMKDTLNNRVKHRDDWRPFAPSILAEDASKYLEDAYPSPFMILCFNIKEEARKDLLGATHIDGTLRPQTVEKDTNPLYHGLISEFKKLTGVSAVLNTSFNLKGEPVVCSPRDAIRTFFGGGMDYMAIGDFIVSK